MLPMKFRRSRKTLDDVQHHSRGRERPMTEDSVVPADEYSESQREPLSSSLRKKLKRTSAGKIVEFESRTMPIG